MASLLSSLTRKQRARSRGKKEEKKRGRPHKLKDTNDFPGAIDGKEKSTTSSEKEMLLDDSKINVVSDLSEETLQNIRQVEMKSKKISLMELTERTCKWPIGDPATDNFWFCGHESEPGKPYCKTHISIAFQPITQRRSRKETL